jgi:hypothetical protein
VGAVKDTASSARDAIVQRVDDLGDTVHRASDFSRDRLHSGVEWLKRNPFALTGGALVVGLGIGLALPTTEAETRVLAKPARKARAQARHLLDEGRETTRRVRDELQEATSEAKEALRGSGSSEQPH